MKEKMHTLYKCSYEYLLKIKPVEISEAGLNKYFIGDRRDFKSIQDVYEQFISSAQNYRSMPNTIKYTERRVQIKSILYDFNVQKIKAMDVGDLYYKFRDAFSIMSNDSKMNSWYKWSCSVVDSAKFLSEFKNTDDFREFVKRFDYNRSTRMALPLLIHTKIRGIGFALACDALKELGYIDYPKPDVHLIEIFSRLGLSESDPVSVFETIVEMADVCKEIDPEASPYKINKILWLICSGRFYLDDISVGRHKDDFIETARMELSIK